MNVNGSVEHADLVDTFLHLRGEDSALLALMPVPSDHTRQTRINGEARTPMIFNTICLHNDGRTLHIILQPTNGAVVLAQVEALAEVAEGRIQPTPQPEDGATYAAKITPDDGRLDWSLPAPVLERVIRALTPRPGAWFVHGDERIRVLAAEFADAPPVSLPGLVLDEHLTIACGNGALRCLRVQRQGKAAMETEAFLRGFDIGPGTQLDLP